ncbi:patched family-domain-containing protein [Salix suchowensis]|nr:patched family-domain-containing protein [Salix suchowensis]
MEWETALRQYLSILSGRAPSEAGLEIAFSTGVSLEEEINKSTNMDVKIVVLSYLAMFFYVVLTLGSNADSREEEGVTASLARWGRNFPKQFSRSMPSSLSIDSRETPTLLPRLPRRLFVGAKFSLGLFGILLVILSVASSVGFFSLLDVKVTLIIAEVIPFLVLAVGVDNVYLLVHELDRQNLLHGPNASASLAVHGEGDYATTTMSPTSSHRSPFPSTHDGDSASMPIILSAEERVARTLAKMGPSICSAQSLKQLLSYLEPWYPCRLCEISLYMLQEVFSLTRFCKSLCSSVPSTWILGVSNRVDCFPCIRMPSRIALLDGPQSSNDMGPLARLIRHYYAPFLLRPFVKGVVLALFGGAFVASVISIQHIELGLDQRLALPSDSYLVSYFNLLDEYLDIGPPVYFVSRNVDVSQRPGQQALCGRFTTCQDLSVGNYLEAERKRPDVSFMSQPAASWIDDFFRWLDPAQDTCCRVRRAAPDIFCGPNEAPRRCRPCYEGREPAWNITMDGFPEDEQFMRYLQQWLISPTTEECPLAGKASFGTALSLSDEGTSVIASHFRTSHKPLKTQSDFINAFAAAHRVAEDISRETGVDVFPYSIFYVFFDQYAHIVAITQEILGLGLASVLIVTALLLGSWRTGTIVTAVVALTVINVMGMMATWGVSLNAISLVNLVISLGIAVEFCAHVARAFMNTGSGLPVDHPAGQRERDERMWTALVDVGPSVSTRLCFYLRLRLTSI